MSLLFLVVLFPSAVLSGEFSRDLELTVPGLLFWLGIFFWSKRYLYPLRKHAPPAKSSTPPVAPAAPPTGQRTAADDDRT